MNIQQHNRFQRIFIDNFFLLEIINDQDHFIFKISGSTQNIYSVKIMKSYPKNRVFCDCQDMKKWCRQYNVLCKHILFVIFKVLKLFIYNNQLSSISVCNNGTEFLETKTLNRDYIELISVFCDLFNFDKASNDIVNHLYTHKYNYLLNNKSESKIASTSGSIKSDSNEPTNCIICFDIIETPHITESDNMNVFRCSQCVGIFHTKCLKKWLDYNKSCPYCRNTMNISQLTQQYLNLCS